MAERRAANTQVLEGMGGTLPGAARPLLRSVQTPTLLPAPLLKDCRALYVCIQALQFPSPS